MTLALPFFDKPSSPLFASICRFMLTVLSRHKNVWCSNLQIFDQSLCCLFQFVPFGTQDAIIELIDAFCDACPNPRCTGK
jgi:hypothetical protein